MGRSSEPARSGEKSVAATRSPRVKMGGDAEGTTGEAPDAKREVPRWVGISEARSWKKGDCRVAQQLPRREEVTWGRGRTPARRPSGGVRLERARQGRVSGSTHWDWIQIFSSEVITAPELQSLCIGSVFIHLIKIQGSRLTDIVLVDSIKQ
jgi:hypothetical protein